MRLKNIIWFILCLILTLLIYNTTNASSIFSLDPFLFLLSFILYFLSISFWIFAWIYLIKEKFLPSFRLNMKALLGVFAPFGLGGDAIRTYFAKTENISPEKALSSSFIIKFYKFIVMIVFLLLALYLLSARSPDFPKYSLVFISMIFVMICGMIIILSLRLSSFANLLYRLLNRIFVFRFHKQLRKQFLGIKPKDVLVLVFLLVISTFLEMGAIMFAMQSIGQALLLPHIFILSSIASSLALVAITPQGIGFVEAGGFLVLSSGYFALSTEVIGSFLIVWSVIRIWLPSVIGLISFRLGK
jgi:uncharacterized membrane protein YbhN (UPF0104 family)